MSWWCDPNIRFSRFVYLERFQTLFMFCPNGDIWRQTCCRVRAFQVIDSLIAIGKVEEQV